MAAVAISIVTIVRISHTANAFAHKKKLYFCMIYELNNTEIFPARCANIVCEFEAFT